MMQIDANKFIYIVPLKKPEIFDNVVSKLIELGFAKNRIVNQDPRKFGQIGDYTAQAWFPNEPTELVIGKITKVETIPPQREGDGETNLIQYDTLLRTELFDKEVG